MKWLTALVLVLSVFCWSLIPGGGGKAEAERSGVPILMYHSIGDNPNNELVISPERFSEEMEYLKKSGYTTLSFVELLNWKKGQPLPPKSIVITLDDGYVDNYSIAFPILQKFQIKATIFLATGFVGQPGRLTWEQIKKMAHAGFIEFGAHTTHHVDLKKSSQKIQQIEIAGSRNMLEEKIGTSVIAFAYPSGQFNELAVQVVKDSGFEFAVTTKPGWAKAEQGYFTLHRVRINGSLTLAGFKKLLS